MFKRDRQFGIPHLCEALIFPSGQTSRDFGFRDSEFRTLGFRDLGFLFTAFGRLIV